MMTVKIIQIVLKMSTPKGLKIENHKKMYIFVIPISLEIPLLI